MGHARKPLEFLNKYTPEEAAEFLKITPELLKQWTDEGRICLRAHGREKFYLGGELDAAAEGNSGMSAMKRFAEKVSVDMGFDGEINDEVMQEGSRRLQQAKTKGSRRLQGDDIREAYELLGFDKRLTLADVKKSDIVAELSREIGRVVSRRQIEAALEDTAMWRFAL